MEQLLVPSVTKTTIQKYFPLIVICFLLFPLAVLYAHIVFAPCDDAYIILVYVRNFLAGNGWTYNGARVEGFSSTLWVALLTFLGLTQIALPALAQTLSLISGLLCLFAVYYLGTKLSLDRHWALLIPLLLVATGDFAFYISNGLEQVLFTALVAWCVAQSISEDPKAVLHSLRFPLSMAAMILTRPEGALISVVLLLWMAFSARSLFSAIRCGILLMLILSPVLIGKRFYYGYWLPNTYYVKGNAGFSNVNHGIGYVRYAMRRYNLVLLTLAAFLTVAVMLRRFQLIARILPLLFIILVWTISVVIQGGDNMVGRRVLLPVFPVIYAALVCLLTAVRFRIALVVSALLSVFLIYRFFSDKPVMKHIQGWRQEYVLRQKVGIYLHKNFPKRTLVALNAAGIIPFYSELPTIDMLGLNNAYIAHYGKRDRTMDYAHQAGDGAYVLSRKPDVILFGSALGEYPGKVISDQEIWASPEFHENYTLENWTGIGDAWVRRKIDGKPVSR